MGGSQGARARASGVAFVHLAGSEEAASTLRAAYAGAGVTHTVLPFLRDVGLAYRAADLAVVRGGGATLAELLATGLPSRVVPLRGVADDHQQANALAFARTGAGEVLDEATLGAAALTRVLDALDDEVALERARERALRAGRPDAASVVARRLLRVANFTVDGVELADESSAAAVAA